MIGDRLQSLQWGAVGSSGLQRVLPQPYARQLQRVLPQPYARQRCVPGGAESIESLDLRRQKAASARASEARDPFPPCCLHLCWQACGRLSTIHSRPSLVPAVTVLGLGCRIPQSILLLEGIVLTAQHLDAA